MVAANEGRTLGWGVGPGGTERQVGGLWGAVEEGSVGEEWEGERGEQRWGLVRSAEVVGTWVLVEDVGIPVAVEEV